MRIDEKNHLLSGGERQKIAIIRELLKQPSLLLLDEPTASMDQTSAEILLNELNSIKRTLLLLSQHMTREYYPMEKKFYIYNS